MKPRHLYLGTAAVALVAVTLWARGAWSSAGPLDNLASQDGTVRGTAIDQLVQGGVGQLDMLLTELETGSHSSLVRFGIGEAMRRIGVGNAEAARLTALLSSPNPEKRSAALHALSSNGSLARAKLFELAHSPREKAPLRAAAARALGTGGSAARAGLHALALDLSLPSDLRHAAIDALALCTGPAAGDVAALALDASRPAGDRQRAVWALAEPGASGGADALHGLLAADGAEGETRAGVVSALASRANLQDLPFVSAQLTDVSGAVRFAALRGLGRLTSEAAHLPEIEGLLTDSDRRVQTSAIEVVGRVSQSLHKDVTRTLQGLLGDPNFRVRYESANALYLHQDRSGAAAMLKDSLSTNQSEALMASQLYTRILTLR
jgi:HEAT repeat protein